MYDEGICMDNGEHFVVGNSLLEYACLPWIVATYLVALFPGSCAGEEEREHGTHCSRMCQVPLV